MKFLLSPCGTSTLTNLATPKERKLISQYANVNSPREVLDSSDLSHLEGLINQAKGELSTADLQRARDLSAELKCLIHYCEFQFDPADQHVLLCTDTWLGEETGKLIQIWLQNQGASVQLVRHKDLQTYDPDAFQLSLAELVSWCSDTIPGYRKAHYRIIFNLTGGFKSIQGFLQTLAMFYADETIYTFERSETLLRIPRLPVKLDAVASIQEHLEIFRRLSQKLPVQPTSNLPETLIRFMEGQPWLSEWGRLVWEQSKQDIYGEKLLPSISPLIHFGPHFSKTAEKIARDRLIILNTRLDQLACFVETNYNPPSLDFKALKGDPVPGSTHEFDAWADLDAKRVFCHYDGNTVVLDSLAKKLS
ncbi:MAG: hypothetical protein Q6M54_15635 [Thermostichus sp. DRC_bins_24]